ncbi:ras-related protein rab-5c [Anaeramoeba flamelloides]|uniref:Ras-related protein rab-5c n=1 Tax=Anaeramoeba flamelloides TaxID=1746091 RepID=A0AAV7ZIZ6_9EUKA|nr:ras-related protein rab-5c [Anaeramoeba flamelloides]KAJ6236247.1 ras-related protein rab-5c [Anaeramoeba flamelloides]
MDLTYFSDSSEEEHKPTVVLKIVMLGKSGCGKTSMILRFVQHKFMEKPKTTIGANFFLRVIQIENKSVCLRLWDTSGQERFNSLTPLYYRNSNAAILVYDLEDITSFQKIKFWINEIKNNTKTPPIIAIVGNKLDGYEEERDEKTYLKAKKYAKSIGAMNFKTSAKTGEGIDDLFKTVAQRVLRSKKPEFFEDEINKNEIGVETTSFQVEKPQTNSNSNGGCC